MSATKSAADAKFTMILSGDTPRAARYDLAESARRSARASSAAPALIVAEGYATAAQVAEAAGQATIAAFDSGNLEAVAKALHEKFPDKPVIKKYSG